MHKLLLTLGAIAGLALILLVTRTQEARGPGQVFADDDDTPVATATVEAGPTIEPTPAAAPASTATLQDEATTPDETIVSVIPDSRSIGCNASTDVTVIARTGSDDLPNGASVSLATSIGVISPETAALKAGISSATFSGDGTAGTAVIEASVMGFSGQAEVQLTC